MLLALLVYVYSAIIVYHCLFLVGKIKPSFELVLMASTYPLSIPIIHVIAAIIVDKENRKRKETSDSNEK